MGVLELLLWFLGVYAVGKPEEDVTIKDGGVSWPPKKPL